MARTNNRASPLDRMLSMDAQIRGGAHNFDEDVGLRRWREEEALRQRDRDREAARRSFEGVKSSVDSTATIPEDRTGMGWFGRAFDTAADMPGALMDAVQGGFRRTASDLDYATSDASAALVGMGADKAMVDKINAASGFAQDALQLAVPGSRGLVDGGSIRDLIAGDVSTTDFLRANTPRLPGTGASTEQELLARSNARDAQARVSQQRVESARRKLAEHNTVAEQIGETLLDVAGSPTSGVSIIGGPLGTVAMGEGGLQAYAQARREGLSRDDAMIMAGVSAGAESISLIPAGKLVSRVPIIGAAADRATSTVASSIMRGVGRGAVGEGLSETATGAIEDAGQLLVANLTDSQKLEEYARKQAPKDAAEFATDRWRDFRAGAVMGGAITGATTGIQAAAEAGSMVADANEQFNATIEARQREADTRLADAAWEATNARSIEGLADRLRQVAQQRAQEMSDRVDARDAMNEASAERAAARAEAMSNPEYVAQLREREVDAAYEEAARRKQEQEDAMWGRQEAAEADAISNAIAEDTSPLNPPAAPTGTDVAAVGKSRVAAIQERRAAMDRAAEEKASRDREAADAVARDEAAAREDAAAEARKQREIDAAWEQRAASEEASKSADYSTADEAINSSLEGRAIVEGVDISDASRTEAAANKARAEERIRGIMDRRGRRNVEVTEEVSDAELAAAILEWQNADAEVAAPTASPTSDTAPSRSEALPEVVTSKPVRDYSATIGAYQPTYVGSKTSPDLIEDGVKEAREALRSMDNWQDVARDSHEARRANNLVPGKDVELDVDGEVVSGKIARHLTDGMSLIEDSSGDLHVAMGQDIRPKALGSAPLSSIAQEIASENTAAESRAALKNLMPEATDAELDAMLSTTEPTVVAKVAKAGTPVSVEVTPSDTTSDAVTLEEVRDSVIGSMQKSGANVALVRMSGNGQMRFVDASTRPSSAPEGAAAWYDGRGITIDVSKLNRDTLNSDLLTLAAHEMKHAADVMSADGAVSTSAFIGKEANARIVKAIRDAAAKGDPVASEAIRKAEESSSPEALDLEIPAYYINESSGTGGIVRNIVSAVRVGAKDMLGIKNVNLADVQRLADLNVRTMAKSDAELTGDLDNALASSSLNTRVEQEADSVVRGINDSVKERLSKAARSMWDSTGGLGGKVRDALEESVGNSAYYAMRAQQMQHDLDNGMAAHAKKNGKDITWAKKKVSDAMDSLTKIPDVKMREKALAAFVKANPDLAVMQDMYKTISQFSNKIADDIVMANPEGLTPKDKQFVQKLRDSSFAYTTRIFATLQGKDGKKLGKDFLNKVAEAKRKPANSRTSMEKQAVEVYDAAAKLVRDRVTIPSIGDMVNMRESRFSDLYTTWMDRNASEAYAIAEAEGRQGGRSDEAAAVYARAKMAAALDQRGKKLTDKEYNIKVGDVVRDVMRQNESKGVVARRIGGLEQDRGILQKREDMPPEFRRLLQEVTTEPALVLATTIARQGELVARTKFLMKLSEDGLVIPNTQRELDGNEKFSVQLTGDNVGPLKGMYTTPDIARAIESQLSNYSSVSEAMRGAWLDTTKASHALAAKATDVVAKGAGAMKISSIIFDPFNFAMNTAGSPLMLALNGVYNPKYAADAVRAGTRAVYNTATAGGAKRDALLEDGVKYQLIDSARVQELRRTNHEALRDRVLEASAGKHARRKVAQGYDTVLEGYSMGDAWVKLAAFEQRTQFLTDYYKAEGVKKSIDEIKSEAAATVRDTNISYNRTPPALRQLERVGLTTFAGYFYNVPRVMMYAAFQAHADFKTAMESRTPEGRNLALQQAGGRLVGLGAASAGAVVAAQALASAFHTDDEEEMVEAMQKGMDDQSRFGVPLYLGKDESGTPLFFRLGRVDPLGPVNDMIRMAFDDSLSAKQKVEKFGEMTTELMFMNRVTETLAKLAAGEDGKKKPYRVERLEAFGAGTAGTFAKLRASGMSPHVIGLIDSVIPGWLDSIDTANAQLADGSEAGTLASILATSTLFSGGRLDKYQPSTQLRSEAFEVDNIVKDARSNIGNLIRADSSPREIAGLVASAERDVLKHMRRMGEIYESMIGSGMSPREAQAQLKEHGSLKPNQIAAIVRGIEDTDQLGGIYSVRSLRQMDKRFGGDGEVSRAEYNRKADEMMRTLREEYNLR